jgi:KaiC/GvpD/RAD55 family RecA-like ATPase
MSDRIFLPTGIEHLNHLLTADLTENEPGGFLIKGNDQSETPIIMIEGDTGTGKTTLSLQIIHAAAQQKEANWVIYYYSLEQSSYSLMDQSKNFGFYEEEKLPPFYSKDERDINKIDNENNYKIHFCHFSPKPITTSDERDVYEQRLAELTHAVLKLSKLENDSDVKRLFVIDCLNALSGKKLDRSDLYRLFSLFRVNKIPAIFTLEYPSQLEHRESQDVASDCARYLADVVISLTRESPIEYNQFYLEIVKSRTCRQALGKHLYKIRTKQNKDAIKTDNRVGFVVYPSIHYVLSRVRSGTKIKCNSRELAEWTKNDFIVDENANEAERKYYDLGLILNSGRISSNSSIAIVGPDGTHKLALGLNFAFGIRKNNYGTIFIDSSKKPKTEKVKPKVLIINFGGSSYMNFQGIAWTEQNTQFRRIEYTTENNDESKIKFWHTEYKIKLNENDFDEDISAVMTSFKVGQLTAEECFDVIDKRLEEEESKAKDDGFNKIFPFTAAIICNTAELCTGFPLLKKDPLFLPSLIDLFEEHKLVTISLGVESDKNIGNDEENFALLARADYRIKLFHYPSVEKLSKNIVERKKSSYEQQLVGLIIDNVTGKHYSRMPRWLTVEMDGNYKILRCLGEPKLK